MTRPRAVSGCRGRVHADTVLKWTKEDRKVKSAEVNSHASSPSGVNHPITVQRGFTSSRLCRLIS